MRSVSMTLSMITIVSLLVGCGGEADQKVTVKQTTKLLSANISTTQKSIQKSRLIDAKTMVRWVNDWQKNRPSAVKGKLIILQVGKAFMADDKHSFIKHDDKNVFTFNKTGGCSNTDPMFDRTDGVSVIPKAVLSGEMMDGAFKMYDIDPINDMLLIVAGGSETEKGMSENAAATARFAWSMKYWGLPHYAVLDGNIQYMLNSKANTSIKNMGINSLDDIFVSEESTPSMNGIHSVKELSTMHQDVMATLTEMIHIVKNCPSRAFIVDARSADEYYANNDVKKSNTEAKICGKNHDEQCYTAIEGHIKGAKHIEYTDFLRRDDAVIDVNGDGNVDILDASYRYKSTNEMMNILKQNGFNVNCQTLYTYCRTGTRAALPAFIGTDILHIETKLFDGSWIEWGRLAGKVGTVDVNGNILLREDSPWRTDIPALTEKLTYNPSNEVAPRTRIGSPLQADEYACNADKIKCDDIAYMKDK